MYCIHCTLYSVYSTFHAVLNLPVIYTWNSYLYRPPFFPAVAEVTKDQKFYYVSVKPVLGQFYASEHIARGMS
jgi:hypothetical protein